MKKLETTIEIAAPAERVWAILSDFPAYPRWNPFIVQIEGKVKGGAVLTVQLALPGRSGMTFRPKLTAVVPPRELVWVGQVLAPGLLDGEHRFEIIPLDRARCRLDHSEAFMGVLVPVFFPALRETTRQGFEAMNQALKARAEASP